MLPLNCNHVVGRRRPIVAGDSCRECNAATRMNGVLGRAQWVIFCLRVRFLAVPGALRAVACGCADGAPGGARARIGAQEAQLFWRRSVAPRMDSGRGASLPGLAVSPGLLPAASRQHTRASTWQ